MAWSNCFPRGCRRPQSPYAERRKTSRRHPSDEECARDFGFRIGPLQRHWRLECVQTLNGGARSNSRSSLIACRPRGGAKYTQRSGPRKVVDLLSRRLARGGSEWRVLGKRAAGTTREAAFAFPIERPRAGRRWRRRRRSRRPTRTSRFEAQQPLPATRTRRQTTSWPGMLERLGRRLGGSARWRARACGSPTEETALREIWSPGSRRETAILRHRERSRYKTGLIAST